MDQAFSLPPRFLFTIANNGHDKRDYVKCSEMSKLNAAKKFDARHILHNTILEYIPTPSNVKLGYLEKFELLRSCPGDVFFTDSDVVITSKCPNPFTTLDPDCFHAVWESEYLVKSRYYEELWPIRNKIYQTMSSYGWPVEANTNCPRFFNSGVLYIPNKVRIFFVSRLGEIKQMIEELNNRLQCGFADQEVFNFIVRHYNDMGLLKVCNLPPSWNVQVSLECEHLDGRFFWQRFRRYRYWRKQAYWCKQARFDELSYCVHYTGKSRSLMIPEFENFFAPAWSNEFHNAGMLET